MHDCQHVLVRNKKRPFFVYALKFSFPLLLNLEASCSNAKALGMENGKIPDSAISFSSVWGFPLFSHNQCRLNEQSIYGGWVALFSILGQWLQVDFQAQVLITGFATQGRNASLKEWVTSYAVSYSHNGNQFFAYKNNKVRAILKRFANLACPAAGHVNYF